MSWLFVGALVAVLHLVRKKRGPESSGEWASAARSPVTLLLTLACHRVAVFWLGIPVLYRIYYNRFLTSSSSSPCSGSSCGSWTGSTGICCAA